MRPLDLDVVVVGAGIQGAGVAQAAAAAGHDVVVLERDRPAAATSSRSSKLIHGGLRYLETGQLGLVRESLRERQILMDIAPDLVRLVSFYLPVYRTTRRRTWQLRAGLALYWALGGGSADMKFDAVPRSGRDDLDGLRTEGLQAVLRYRDAQTDDAALTRAVLRSAEALGARFLCPAEFRSARRERDACEVDYVHAGGEHTARCRVLINAAGPWVPEVLRRIDPPVPRLGIELVQGSHVEFPGTLCRGVYYTEAPQDGRAVFVMPWHDRTLVGTTETPFEGDPATVRPTGEEVEYLRETYRHYFRGRDDDILDSWAGLRVLPAGTGSAFRRPREVVLSADPPARPTVVTLAGGKLTTYRATAKRVVAMIATRLPEPEPRADTATLRL